jgi:hypothetical protein
MMVMTSRCLGLLDDHAMRLFLVLGVRGTSGRPGSENLPMALVCKSVPPSRECQRIQPK